MAYATKPGDYPKLALYPDGVWGRGTVGALQYALGHYLYAYPGRPLVDGVFGSETKRYLQKFLKLQGRYSGVIDGVAGAMTWTALRDYLWFDTRLGSQLYGSIPSGTTSAPGWLVKNLQRYLNQLRPGGLVV